MLGIYFVSGRNLGAMDTAVNNTNQPPTPTVHQESFCYSGMYLANTCLLLASSVYRFGKRNSRGQIYFYLAIFTKLLSSSPIF